MYPLISKVKSFRELYAQYISSRNSRRITALLIRKLKIVEY